MKLPSQVLGIYGMLLTGANAGSTVPGRLMPLLETSCLECHDREAAKGGLDLTALPFDLADAGTRERWIRIHDRIEKGEMPPKAEDLPVPQRAEMLGLLSKPLDEVDHAEILANGRGPLRRMNRDEYEQNLRDALQLPDLDIRDLLPEDREGHHSNKASETLDMSRVQLTAYLDAAETALKRAMASSLQPPISKVYRAEATRLFQEVSTFGNREAMFYARDSKMIPLTGKQLQEIRQSGQHDPEVEMALFRSASWPYYGYPEGFIARLPGEYRVRFTARAVVQLPGYTLKPATHPVPMTFRARKPSGADVSGDVRATGGIMDIQPEPGLHETTIHLRERETVEYSLLGLPVPLARNVNNGPPSYRYPPFPEGGQPGVAFQWIEIEGPISPAMWPPPSHQVLLGDLPLQTVKGDNGYPVGVVSQEPVHDARRLLRRFVAQVAREPVPEDTVAKYERLVLARLEEGAPFAEALLAGYKAFLCSSHFLYLREPRSTGDHFAIASRLAHFLTNTRPDSRLVELAQAGKLREATVLHAETERLITNQGFDRFVKSFTDYWLNLRHVRRDEPDIRLYPEYRFDDYLVESMEMETRAFFTAMVRENLPARNVIDCDFVFANDRMAQHYGLPALNGSLMRKVSLPEGSPYGGLLTQAAVLKVTANGTTTSPVVRGAWIMERLLGEAPPPPPASVPAVEPDIRGAKTMRELLALHTKSKSCATCHAHFDPVGLALENFDIMGGWRARYRGLEQGQRVTGIDRAGHDFAYTLAGTVDASGQLLDGHTFQNIRELKRLLAAQPRQLARNLLHQFTLYATGVPVRFSDRPEIESLLDACEPEGYRVKDLMLALIQSRIFLGEGGCQ